MKTFFRFVALSIFCLPSVCMSEHYKIFTDGKSAPNYRSIVANLHDGDTVEMSSGKIFTIVGDELGHGNTTRVFALDEKRVLRLPIDEGFYKGEYAYRTYIRMYIAGAKMLHDLQVPVPKVLEFDESKSEFAVVERIQIQFKFGDFVIATKDLDATKVMQSPWAKAWSEFQYFVRQTAHLRTISDFKPNNLVWTPDGWIVLDFTGGGTVFGKPGIWGKFVDEMLNRVHIFSNFRSKELSPWMRTEIESIIRSEREHPTIPGIFNNCNQVRATL